MPTSEARIEANRLHAQPSTGPRSGDGEGRARLDAFRQGLAGAGDPLRPGADERAVAELAHTFGRELGAVGEVGRRLARRAAVMSIRLEESAARDRAASAARARSAAEEFDRERLDAFEAHVRALDADDNPLAAQFALQQTPEGVEHLIESWALLLDELAGPDEAAARVAARRAAAWLDLPAPAPGDPPTSRPLLDRIKAEVHRLGERSSRMDDVAEAIAAGRAEAALLASFDPSPEADLARRHEAAAERSMYRAFRAIADHRRAQNLPDALPMPLPPERPERPADSRPSPTPTPSPIPTPDPLGSFPIPDLLPVAATPQPRPKRPDLRKIHGRR